MKKLALFIFFGSIACGLFFYSSDQCDRQVLRGDYIELVVKMREQQHLMLKTLESLDVSKEHIVQIRREVRKHCLENPNPKGMKLPMAIASKAPALCLQLAETVRRYDDIHHKKKGLISQCMTEK